MADVFLDPRLPDYFTEIKHRSALDAFLGEKIALIRDVSLYGLDMDYLATVDLPQTWEMKKLQVDRVLSGKTDLGGKFKEQMERLRTLSWRILEDVLPGVYRPQLIVRFSETRMENLHYDLDTDIDDHESFRLYINLDKAPRLWATSYQISDLIKQGGKDLWAGVPDGAPSEAYLKRITTRAFGGWHQRATERTAPRHFVYFDPGDVWVVDGRSVSHQVMTGHRVLSVYCRLSHHENPDLAGNTFKDKLRDAMKRAPQESTIPLQDPHKVGSANIKGDWGKVFGKTGSGGLRRFTDAGLEPVG